MNGTEISCNDWIYDETVYTSTLTSKVTYFNKSLIIIKRNKKMPKQFQIISNRKTVDTDGNIDALTTHVHDRPLSWRDTDTSIKSGWDKLVV